MGLLKGLGKLATGVAKTAAKTAIENYPKMQQKAQEQRERQIRRIRINNELRERMEARSSRELKKIVSEDGFFSASEREKKMALQVLKSRGEI
jgi:hypothetical protein